MTAEDFVIAAKRRLNIGAAGHPFEGFDIDLAACLPAAIGEMSVNVMNDDARRGLLQQSYSVTLDANGIGDYLAATGSITSVAGEILSEGIYVGMVKDGDGEVLFPIKNYPQFISPQPLFTSYYCLVNKKIHTRSRQQQVTVPGDVLSVTTPLTIFASYTPASPADVPSELEDDVVECLCKIAMQKYATQQSKKNA